MSQIQRDADFSVDRIYRYRLSRVWGEGEGARATFVMLNPSTADEHVEDRTIGRCIAFAKRWGFAGLNVVNLYAFRSTDPAGLWRVADPVGSENDSFLQEAATSGDLIVAAWGAHAKKDRVDEVLAIPGLNKLTCLATTKQGYPRHPLYLSGSLMPIPGPG